MTTFNVNILLSSYNGQLFIRDQLDSLLKQTYKNITIYIRDDGSTDATISIIEPYIKANNNIHLITGNNVGVIQSFLTLLKQPTCLKNELYAFCDQDDIWLPDKIERAVTFLSEQASPESSLYCSRLEYVDESLNHLGYTLTPKVIGFNNAIVENIAVGCTTVFGSEIRDKMLQASTNKMMMHDWWAYLTASAFGNVIFDNKTTILYRQHGNNVTAFEPGLTKINARFKRFVSRLLSNKHSGLDSLNQAIHFKNTYQNLPSEYAEVIDRLVSLREKHKLIERIKYILNPEVNRTNSIEDWALKPLILFGWH